MKWTLFWRLLQRRRGLVTRGLLCWAIGWLILVNDEVNSYDARLQMRGAQPISQQVVLLTIHPSDVAGFTRFRQQNFDRSESLIEVTDSFYWDKALWLDLLSKVLKQNPRKVGVTLFFSENLNNSYLHREQLKILKDPRVMWAASATLTERTHLPLLSNDIKTNIGTHDLLRDEDGVIRRFVPAGTEIPHLAEKLTETNIDPLPNRFINYRGTKSQFARYTARDVLDGRIPESMLTNKIILIGSEATASSQFLTPLGSSERHEVIAQIVDNILEKRWIHRFHSQFYAIGLFFLMLISVFAMTSYPQSVALVLMAWLATMAAAMSAWVFDGFYIWFPAVSPAIQLAATWVIFIGYQANKIERQNWRLQQEQAYFQELEQLKNNFVSLISHDLKTPIAKIQAIVDRLLSQNPTHEFQGDLKSLRVSSEELNRYIQSILKVLRVESRDFRLNKEVGDINETIQDAIIQLTPLATEKQIRIEQDLEPLFAIEVDFTLIREVLVNLVENAIKYTPVGGSIRVSSKETNESILVSVTDTGEGIPSDEVNNVWHKFVRGKDQDLKTKGSGLGLYLVKYFIELHGGTVQLESELKKGTKVSFRLPLDMTDTEEVSS